MNMVAEGYIFPPKTMKEVNEEVKADMPILDAVHDIIYNHLQAKRIMMELTRKII